MNRYINGILLKVHRYYTKDGFVDGEFSACFVSAVLFTSTLNLLNAIVFYVTKIETLRFNLSPVGVILLVVIGILTLYFSRNKNELLKRADIEYSKTEHRWMNIIIFLCLALGYWHPLYIKWELFSNRVSTSIFDLTNNSIKCKEDLVLLLFRKTFYFL